MAALLLAWQSLGGEPETQQSKVMSGVARTKLNERGQELRWKQRDIVIAIDSSVDELGPGAREAVQGAFASWLESDAVLPKLSFDSTNGRVPSERPDGVNAVMVAPIEIPGHRQDLAITLTFSDVVTGEIIEADLVINSRHDFGVLDFDEDEHEAREDDTDQHDRTGDDRESSDGERRTELCQRRYDLQNVATHEAGHFFGLGEDVEEQETTMYQSIQRCEVMKRTIESGDRLAIGGLYVGNLESPAEPEESAKGCGGASVSSRKPRTSELFGPGLLLVLGALRSRRRR